jgi:nucleotide-binding universal stress UspA family protein
MSNPQESFPVAQPDPIPAPTGIVVGIDGSEQSNCALVWAAREAKLRKLPLHLVTAYTVPIFAASGLDGGYATVDDDVIRQGAEAVLREAAATIAHDELELDARVENGDADGVLL